MLSHSLIIVVHSTPNALRQEIYVALSHQDLYPDDSNEIMLSGQGQIMENYLKFLLQNSSVTIENCIGKH